MQRLDMFHVLESSLREMKELQNVNLERQKNYICRSGRIRRNLGREKYYKLRKNKIIKDEKHAS